MRSVICSQWTRTTTRIESRRCHTITFRATNAATNKEVPQLDETADGAIAVEPTVFNSILEVGALRTTILPCRMHDVTVSIQMTIAPMTLVHEILDNAHIAPNIGSSRVKGHIDHQGNRSATEQPPLGVIWQE